jgi:phosphohistidine phosphatase
MGRVTSGQRTLVVVRHAKAEPYAETDHARRLTDRGRGDAADAGGFLASAGIRPTHALVSDATRTRETWAELRASWGEDLGEVEEEVSPSFYSGSAEEVLAEIRLLPAEATSVVFVGHNPTAAHLARLLLDGDSDPDVMRGLLEGFPPAAVAVLDVPGPWSELTEGGARLTRFHVGCG